MILQFKDEYRWLSNFWYFERPLVTRLCPEEDRIVYPTSEHFYQAMKFDTQGNRRAVANHPLKGLKRFTREMEIHSNWDEIRVSVMEYITRYKFSKHNPKLRQMLLDTGTVEIQEGNHWNDTFWGVDLKTGEGENNLGKIIMKVRQEIREDEGFC